jgi:hypothetical protein
MTLLEWHRMKSCGKRYARWRRIRPHPDPIGDNAAVKFISKTCAKLNNRNARRQFGMERCEMTGGEGVG